MRFYQQHEFNLRCEWGENGIKALASISDVIIIVDVLSFSTAVDVATERKAVIYPYRGSHQSAIDFAASKGALLATKGRVASTAFSLSPTSLSAISAGTRLVLPSPNGSTLSLSTGNKPTLAGCLRNARAVAEFAHQLGEKIAVIPAGERWEDGSLRPAVEDFIGAGAIMSFLKGSQSPESQVAVSVYQSVESNLPETLRRCASGKELIEKGFAGDVELAAQLNCSRSVPLLTEGAYVNQNL